MIPIATPSLGKANPQQAEAILATEGPVLIIAGPGSGKTFTLVERIVYLITEKGVAPESLLVVTFTDKAARELTTRISNRLTELDIQFNLNEMYLGTFHSICLRILEDYREYTRLKRSFTLFDQFDQQYFLYQKIKEFRALPFQGTLRASGPHQELRLLAPLLHGLLARTEPAGARGTRAPREDTDAALKKYCDFMKQTDAFREALDESVLQLDGYIQEQIDRARGK